MFAHVGIRPHVPLADQAGDDLLWIRELFLENYADHGVLVVHRPSIPNGIDARRNRISIDTGARASGRQNAVIVDGAGRRRFEAPDALDASATNGRQWFRAN